MEAEQEAEASGNVPPPPQLPFCLFLISLYLHPLIAPFLNPLSLFPFLIFPSLLKAVATDFEVVRPGSGCGLLSVGVVC